MLEEPLAREDHRDTLFVAGLDDLVVALRATRLDDGRSARSSDGVEFDNSFDRGSTFEFQLGSGNVIQGWDDGVAGMKVGGRRTLHIPAHLGYGSQGAGGVIKPNETLIFVVDLLDVK